MWGVETNQQEEASALKPISQVHDFLGRLKKSLLNSNQPVVDGVVLDVIHREASTTDGYVRCLIPASDKTPHRAMLANREYFKRSIEGFYRLEHFDLEDMFGRRPRPSLSMMLELKPRPGDDDPYEEVHFSVLNEGKGIAKYFGFMCLFESDVSVAGARGGPVDNTRVNGGRPTVTFLDLAGVLHPNGIWGAMGQAIVKRAAKSTPLLVTITWYCEGMTTRTAQVHVLAEARVLTSGTVR